MDSDYYSLTQNTGTPASRTTSAGTINRIQMKNFMCHDNLEVNLNPRINFICGSNGSGKSAIQTAIAIGLGGKAIATNRGSSIKDLIKNDKNSSCINIDIANDGPLAYRPQDYGPFIQVERFFSHSSQGYKIKNAFGKLVSTEKKELDRIVSYFNIQIDNPVCILHQDMARNFLNSTNPGNKFKFFMKASQLDDITALYLECSFKVITMKEMISDKFKLVEESFKDVVEMKRRVKNLEEAKLKESLRETLENELVWAKIHESKLELQQLEKKRECEVADKDKAKKKLDTVEENKMKEKLRELQKRIVEMDELVKDAREKLKPAKNDFIQKKDRLSNRLIELNETKQCLKLNKRKYDNCLAEIENLTKNAPDMKLRQEKLKKEISECEKNLESIKAAENSFEHDRKQLQDTIDNVKKTFQEVSHRCNNLQSQKGKRENQLKQLNKNSTSTLTLYGDIMIRIVNEINKADSQRKFQKKPIGPIGIHIKVRDPGWAVAVENYLGKRFLSSFCVDNAQDRVVLTSILQTVCSQNNSSQPTIICSKFLPQMHNIKQNETGTPQYMNLARALEINNPVVANCLIDQQEVETVLLIPTNNEAYQLLDEQHKVPPNCRKAFTKTGDQFVPAPNYKTYSNNSRNTHTTLLQADHKDIVRDLRNELDKLVHDISVLEGERRCLVQQEKDTFSSVNKNLLELNNLRRQRHVVEQKINDLKASIEPETQTNVGYFVEESKVLQTQLEKEAIKHQELTTECEALETEAKEAKHICDELQNTIAKSDQEKAPIQGEVHHLKSNLQQVSTKAELIKKQIEEHDNKLSQLDTEITELNIHLNLDSENASQISVPVETQRGIEEILRELKAVELYLKKVEEENGGSLTVLQNNLRDREATFNTVNTDLHELNCLIKKAQHSLKYRKSKLSRLQQLVTVSVRHNFELILGTRGYKGKLEFDLEARTLTVKVSPQSNQADLPTKALDTTSLSGGEKSFSTVCFMMALTQEVILPFHFLDEFDVFMDGINRRIVMDLLIANAKEMKRQFVFLTPLNMSSVSISDEITVHRLEAPRQ